MLQQSMDLQSCAHLLLLTGCLSWADTRGPNPTSLHPPPMTLDLELGSSPSLLGMLPSLAPVGCCLGRPIPQPGLGATCMSLWSNLISRLLFQVRMALHYGPCSWQSPSVRVILSCEKTCFGAKHDVCLTVIHRLTNIGRSKSLQVCITRSSALVCAVTKVCQVQVKCFSAHTHLLSQLSGANFKSSASRWIGVKS